jgi:hypothetical protein
MNDTICYLLTILEGDSLMKVVLRLSQDHLQGDCIEYPMEPENRRQLHALLPDHIGSIGPIVAVEQILDVVDIAHSLEVMGRLKVR